MTEDTSDGDEAVAAEAYAAGQARPAALTAFEASGKVRPVEARSEELDALIAKYARHYEVPERLVRRVVDRESDFNPAARNKIYWGLMQIRHDTAQIMGYRGPASGLLDAETNLKYAVKYLRGAYITAGGNEDRAVRHYASGYYYDAKRKGLLKETGLRN
ncbi:lytic transglycosylase domain-containing protein [Chelativorans sp. YIM 93263]|uniref:lytic transglycosylase domain-containing protein n=1 Tax=Chelativorans sp. YIM 93263 TaxID=2906648 RepID=UPI0023794618|nr:lytic transglycosylase domain-containing protein [Chelativorans sp. YIM 93263]